MRNDLSERMDRVAEHDGWTWLLPAGEHAHLVCVDDGSGRGLAALAPLCKRLSVVVLEPRQAARLRGLADEWGLDGVRVHVPGELEAIGEQRVDGVVINLVGARVPARLALAALCQALLALGSATPDVFAYLASGNRLAYNRLLRLGGGRRRIPLSNGPRSLRRLLEGAAYRTGVVHPMVVYGPHVFEVLQSFAAPLSYGKARGAAARLRELALGPLGRGLFAPAYALTGFRGPARPTRLAVLLQEVGKLCVRAGPRPGWTASWLQRSRSC